MSDSDDSHSTPLSGAIFWIAIAFSSFQLLTAAFSPLSSQVVRAVHVGFVLLMIFALRPAFRGGGPGQPVVSWILGLTGFVFSFYHWVFEADLTQRAGDLTRMDWVIGVVTIVLIFEGARRMMGW
ncbi:MAG: TRAP transporter permease, partial [Polaromonas sp.]|nr:TRAP transporter permease [Polaromonas sp.]